MITLTNKLCQDKSVARRKVPEQADSTARCEVPGNGSRMKPFALHEHEAKVKQHLQMLQQSAHSWASIRQLLDMAHKVKVFATKAEGTQKGKKGGN